MNSPQQRQISARRLAWLGRELAVWQRDGIITPEVAERITAGYVPRRRSSLERITVLLGGMFIGIGLIWLVAANIELVSPLWRFAGVTAVWLAAVALGEILAHRATTGKWAGTARLIAAFAAGGVVFQAAQSLQVPAYTSALLGACAAVAYAHATAARSAR